MQSEIISAGTQVVLLLCGHFAPKEPASPLDLREFNRLAEVLSASDLPLSRLMEPGADEEVQWNVARLDRSRVMALLGRGAAMALAVERWTSAGLWILSREDRRYPSRLREHLGRSAPPLLFGAGDVLGLDGGGLAIVGSREVDAEGEAFTASVARQCARERLVVVSGGARGVDEVALSAAFDEGGRVVAVLPDGLARAAVAAKYRQGLREERLVLVSPYAPHAPFSIGNAMGRNRLIYAFADAALVVSSALRSGGTWAGAEEELSRERARPVFVRRAQPPIAGNEALLELGATVFPDSRWASSIRSVLADSRLPFVPVSRVADRPIDAPLRKAGMRAPSTAPTTYQAFLPLLLEVLASARTAAQIADALDVAPAQSKQWVEQAIAEGRVVKSGRPAKFRRVDDAPEQPSLFGN